MNYLIPVQLETERLNLRRFTLDDLNDLYEYYSDAECTKYTTRRALTENETKEKLISLIEHWQLHNYGSYAVEERESKKVIGISGLDYPPDWPEPEIQWALIRKFWGKGYASEAARKVKEIAKKYLPQLSLISLIHPENQNSINLAKSLGAHFEREYYFRHDTWHIYRHT